MLNASKLRAYKALSLSSVRPVTFAPIDAADCGMLADAVEIADSSARSLIECECLAVGGNADEGWHWDISTADPESAAAIEQALRYLEARNLLIRQENAPHIVTFRE